MIIINTNFLFLQYCKHTHNTTTISPNSLTSLLLLPNSLKGTEKKGDPETSKSKKMKLPSFFKNKETTQHPMRQWPSCKQPKTLSFRKEDEMMFKTVNSVYFDPLDIGIGQEARESLFTNSSESACSFSTESEQENNNISGEDSVEMIVRGVRSSERLFFEPGGGASSSILEEITSRKSSSNPSSCELFGLKESVVLALESDDPYSDFKRSMQEMVETNGLKDWDSLEELLGWYLKMNGKMNHGFIVGAFVDLLLGLASSSSSSDDSCSFLSASSSFSSPPSSPLSPVPVGQKGE